MRDHIRLVPSDPVESAWQRYQKLVLAANEDRRLWADRDHCKAIFDAFDEFRDLYTAEAA